MRKRASAAVLGLAIAGVSMFATGSASSHGYTDSPISRQKLCAEGGVSGCGAIEWEPQSVEGPKGFPAAGPQDGAICSAGNSGFAELDDPRDGNWPATEVTAGEGYSFRWQFTARHSTSDFQYYITKDGWDSTKPLTRASLESQPFMTVPYGNQQPPATLTHQGTMPTQKTGKHVVLSVWNVADTPNAFYACSDVNF